MQMCNYEGKRRPPEQWYLLDSPLMEEITEMFNYDNTVQRLVSLEIQFHNKPSPTAEIVVLRHVAAHNATNDSEIHRVVANQYYVDKLNDSQRSTEGTLRLEHNLTVSLGRGNIKIRKWLSIKPDGCCCC